MKIEDSDDFSKWHWDKLLGFPIKVPIYFEDLKLGEVKIDFNTDKKLIKTSLLSAGPGVRVSPTAPYESLLA